MTSPTLYETLRDAGCEIDNHESDLYVRATEDARKILDKFGAIGKPFVSQIDGKLWLDVPFQFDPWWGIHRLERDLALARKEAMLVDLMPVMELRDWFAGMALSGLLSDKAVAEAIGRAAKKGGIDPDTAAAMAAYGYADALLAQKEKTDE